MENLKQMGLIPLNRREQENLNGGWSFKELGRIVGAIFCACRKDKPAGMTWNEYNGKF